LQLNSLNHWQKYLCQILHHGEAMSKPQTADEDVALIPLWVFFASGYKWLAGFVAGCPGFYITQMITPEPLWITLVTAALTFVGWSTGTYLDINTYLNKKQFKPL